MGQSSTICSALSWDPNPTVSGLLTFPGVLVEKESASLMESPDFLCRSCGCRGEFSWSSVSQSRGRAGSAQQLLVCPWQSWGCVCRSLCALQSQDSQTQIVHLKQSYKSGWVQKYKTRNVLHVGILARHPWLPNTPGKVGISGGFLPSSKYTNAPTP